MLVWINPPPALSPASIRIVKLIQDTVTKSVDGKYAVKIKGVQDRSR
jgi:hypothetical protein